jgi:pyruvate dehydrogenase E2 component (dihydrolipoamide acetyltransferase)
VIQLTMPKLSDSMEQGTILSWLKSEGEHIVAGEDLVEIETDKATVTYQAETAGVLSILAAEGTSLSVGSPIATIGPAQEVSRADPAVAAPPAVAEADTASPAIACGSHALASASSSVDFQATTDDPVGRNGGPSGAPKATPVARRIAAAHGVGLEEIEGTGPLGRITRGDVLRKAGIVEPPTPARAAAQPARAPEPADPPRAKGDVEIVVPTRLQSIVARRMAEATATIPHFQVQTEVTMDAAIALRRALKDSGADLSPSYNDMIVKAAALALRAHSRVNSAWCDGQFELYSRVNVGIAVAAGGALVVPTIFDADTKSLGAIAAESRRLAASVRDGSIHPSELSGATFTVSNLGMYGATAITPVINAAQAAILGVGALRQILARVNGEIVERQPCTLTLSCDHRIIYGAHAAEFLSTIRQLLEQPGRLAL